MKNKTSIFASSGQKTAGYSDSDYRGGMTPATVAYAEDVNSFGGEMDSSVYSVCQEIINVLSAYSITPNANDNTQLITALRSKIAGFNALTGLDYSSYTSAPTQSGNSISFPAFTVIFNNQGYYGDKLSQFTEVAFSAQTISASSSDATGVYYIYATSTGTIAKQTTPILGSEAATKCMLGSVFVVNPSGFQSGSWKFQPWLRITSPEMRESPTAETKGGYISAVSGTTLKIGALEIKAEGINFGTNTQAPNILTRSATNPFTYKFLYTNYDPSSSDLNTLDTTHLYNLTSGSWDTLTASSTSPKYMVMVPCITPSGQTLMIPAMSTKTGSNYDSLFDTPEAASSAVYGLQYTNGSVDGLGRTADRAIYLGFSLIVKVGATDLTSADNFAIVGMVPQALAGFTNAGGQTGGGTGSYIPMSEYNLSGSTVSVQNNASNVITGSSSYQVTVNMPSNTAGQENQLQIKYVHSSGYQGLNLVSVTWWDSAPVFTAGKTYLIICEYINGGWKAGYIEG